MAGSKAASPARAYVPQPNWAVKRTPTRAKASPLSWPLLVPCAPSVLRCRLPWALGKIGQRGRKSEKASAAAI